MLLKYVKYYIVHKEAVRQLFLDGFGSHLFDLKKVAFPPLPFYVGSYKFTKVVFPPLPFIANSNAYVYVVIFYCMSGPLICGSRAAINYSLCYTSDIWKVALAMSVLNCWSNSHTISTGAFLISLISVIH